MSAINAWITLGLGPFANDTDLIWFGLSIGGPRVINGLRASQSNIVNGLRASQSNIIANLRGSR